MNPDTTVDAKVRLFHRDLSLHIKRLKYEQLSY